MRNKWAKSLSSPLFRQRKVENKKAYSRSKEKSKVSRLVVSQTKHARDGSTE